MEACAMIKELIASGMTKWQIKLKLDVSWQTVRAWETKKIIPNETNRAKIEGLWQGSVL